MRRESDFYTAGVYSIRYRSSRLDTVQTVDLLERQKDRESRLVTCARAFPDCPYSRIDTKEGKKRG